MKQLMKGLVLAMLVVTPLTVRAARTKRNG